MNFGEVVSKAWKITWKFKVLWIFGMLASCGTRSGGNFNFNSTYRTGENNFSGSAPNLPPGVLNWFNQFVRSFDNPQFVWGFVAAIIAVVCVIVIVELVVGALGRVGLIKGIWEADEGAEKLNFGGLWSRSMPFFWRVFWLSILVGLPFFIIALIIAAGFVLALIPVIDNNSAGAGLAFLTLLPVICVLACVIFILAILVGFIVQMAENAIVIENQTILGGFQRGWDVLVKNLGPILIIWLITAVIGFVAAILIALPLLIVLVPLVFAFIANANSVNFSLTPWLIAFVCIICAYIPISWIANGILMTYIQSVWTLTYLRLTKPKEESQIPIALPTNA
ncbi:MAG: DUF4013 domain-containing protein [Chloroflexi bacterium]|nr:DUF4013 domain-containing protein [Chloroflexota bacterium]